MKNFLFGLVLVIGTNAYATCDSKSDKLAIKNAIRDTYLSSEGDEHWEVFSIENPFSGEVTLEKINQIIEPEYLDQITGSSLDDSMAAVEFLDYQIEDLEAYAEDDEDFYALSEIQNYKAAKETFKELFGEKFYFLEVFEGDEDDGIGSFEKIIFGIKSNGCIIGMRSAEYWT